MVVLLMNCLYFHCTAVSCSLGFFFFFGGGGGGGGQTTRESTHVLFKILFQSFLLSFFCLHCISLFCFPFFCLHCTVNILSFSGDYFFSLSSFLSFFSSSFICQLLFCC